MTGIFALLVGILSSAAMTIVLKIFRRQRGNRYGIILGNYLTCVIIAFLMTPDKGLILQADPSTVICGIIAGILFVAALVSMQSSIRINGAILTSAFSRMGLIVPLLISTIFLREKIRIIQIPGILLVLIAFWLISTDKGSFRDQSSPEEALQVRPLLLLLVLFTFGGGDAMARIFHYTGLQSENQLYFLILFTVAAFLAAALLLLEYRRTGKKPVLKEFLVGILVGIPNYFSSSLLLQALYGLPSFIVYPCFSAGTLVLVTILGAAVFQERPGRNTWIGLGLIIIALICLNL